MSRVLRTGPPCTLACVAIALLGASPAPAKGRSCRALSIHFNGASTVTYPVRILRGTTSCRTARRVLRTFIADAEAPPGWVCFRGHGSDSWAAKCARTSGAAPRGEIRAQKPKAGARATRSSTPAT